MSLTKDGLLGKCHTRYQSVPLPDGDVVVIRSMSEGEKSGYENKLVKKGGGGASMAGLKVARQRLVLWVTCNDDDSPMFPPAGVGSDGTPVWDAQTWDAIDAVDSLVMGHIYDAALQHCGFGKTDVEELVKNSETIRGDGSS